jgi:hypothetical protein
MQTAGRRKDRQQLTPEENIRASGEGKGTGGQVIETSAQIYKTPNDLSRSRSREAAVCGVCGYCQL